MIAAPTYHAYRVADGKLTYSKATAYQAAADCSLCGERVWVQPENTTGHIIVCWPCAGVK